MMVLSFTTNILSVPLNYVSSYLLVPFENGLTSVGTYALQKTQQLQELSSVLDENEKLKEQINVLTIENISNSIYLDMRRGNKGKYFLHHYRLVREDIQRILRNIL